MSLTKEQIEEYFQIYISEYEAFKNEPTYQTILRFLVDYYYDKLYNIDPNLYKQMFEDGQIPQEVYDQLLVAIGLPQNLIDTLSYKSKIIFLKTFSDFERYKATLSFVQNLGKSYNDFLNIYELFIDYDNTDNKWILRPKLVHKNERVDLLTDYLDYDEVYNGVPTLLLDSDELTTLYNNDQIVLPIKSNLLLLDYELSEDISILNSLITSTFIKSYASHNIQVYFDNFSYSIPIKTVYFLWFYLLTRYHGTVWKTFQLNYILNFNVDLNPFYVTDLDNILDEYNLIETREDFELFYDKYLKPFGRFYRTLSDVDEDKMYNTLQIIDEDLTNYLDNRITSSSDEKKEIKIIMDELYNSIILSIDASSDVLYQKYSEYFLRTLSTLSVKPEDTDTYLILSTLKPFHTELVTKSRNTLYCEDKFNKIYFDEETYFIYKLMLASILNIADISYFEFTYKYSDTFPILSEEFIIFKYYSTDNIIEIQDSIKLISKYKATSLLAISDEEYRKRLVKDTNSTFSILDGIVTDFSFSEISDAANYDDFMYSNVKTKSASIFAVSDKNIYKNKITKISDFQILNHIDSFYFLLNNINTHYDILDLPKIVYTENNKHSLFVISDEFEIIEQ